MEKGRYEPEDLIFIIKKTNIGLENQLEKELKNRELSGIQVYLAVYILRHHPEGTYITELFRELGVSKATLSVLVKRLREKGYLHFQEQQEDIRKKKVVPTEKLLNEGPGFVKQAVNVEAEVCRNLDIQEREELCRLEMKILMQLRKKVDRQEVIA